MENRTMLRSWNILFIAAVSISMPTRSALSADSFGSQMAYLKYGEFARQYVMLYEERKFKNAFDLLLKRREAGDAWTTEILAELIFDSPPEMSRIAHAWAERKAGMGDADVQYMLGYTLMHKALFDDRSGLQVALAIKAVEWLDKAAAQGQKDALFALSTLSRKQLEPRGIRSEYLGE